MKELIQALRKSCVYCFVINFSSQNFKSIWYMALCLAKLLPCFHENKKKYKYVDKRLVTLILSWSGRALWIPSFCAFQVARSGLGVYTQYYIFIPDICHKIYFWLVTYLYVKVSTQVYEKRTYMYIYITCTFIYTFCYYLHRFPNTADSLTAADISCSWWL